MAKVLIVNKSNSKTFLVDWLLKISGQRNRTSYTASRFDYGQLRVADSNASLNMFECSEVKFLACL